MNTRRTKTKEPQTPPPSSDLFHPTIATISVAQILQSVGFSRSQTAALDALSRIATLYLQSLAESASSSANSAGRTQCNLLDVVSALEEANSAKGFCGAASGDRSVWRSGVLRDLMWFVWSVDEIPFVKPIPKRERPALLRSKGVADDRARTGAFKHIPAWLPAFPDAGTYKKVKIDGRVWREEDIRYRDEGVVERLSDTCSTNAEKGKKNKKESEKNEKSKKSFLPVKRGKVKFKFGFDLGSSLGVNVELGTRNGACRGGKRVSCSDMGEEEKIECFDGAKRAR